MLFALQNRLALPLWWSRYPGIPLFQAVTPVVSRQEKRLLQLAAQRRLEAHGLPGPIPAHQKFQFWCKGCLW